MKRSMKSILCLVVTATSLTALLSAPAAAKNGVPFRGTIQAVEDSVAVFPPDVPFPTLFVGASGSGRAAHLGRFTVTYNVQVNLNTFFGVGSAEYIAANGDRLFTEGEGQGTVPTEEGISFIEETQIITGGTGRFEGATGSFTLRRVINVFTGVTSGEFEGTIVKAK